MAVEIILEAHDVWFFRTSRPFGAAQSTASDGEAELLPLPGVVFGALRTCIGEAARATHPGWDWDTYSSAWQDWYRGAALPPQPALGLGPPRIDPEQPEQRWPQESLRLVGLLPARLDGDHVEPLFPLPAFVLASKESGEDIKPEDHLRRARPVPELGRFGGSAAGLWPVALPPASHGEGAGSFQGEARLRFVGRRDLLILMRGENPADFRDTPVSPNRLAEEETRIGIARDLGTRRVHEGQLYSLGLHRWSSRASFGGRKTFGLLGRVENASVESFPQPLVLHLGGEQRLAWGRVRPAEPWFDDEEALSVRDAIAQAGGWWLSLMTPAWFRDGWRPAWIEPAAVGHEARLRSRDGQVISAGRLRGFVAPEPVCRSGWDLAARCPKPVRTYLGAGTTWFFETGPAPAAEVLDAVMALQGTCVADAEAHAGYGLCFLGAWTKGDR